MNAQSLVDRARAELADGKVSAALRTAWLAVNQAMLESNEGSVRDLLPVAGALVAATQGREHREADKLARYCGAVLDGVGGGVAAPGVFDRLFGRAASDRKTQRTRCPKCAEDIHVDALVCKHCGYRMAPSPLD